MNVAQNTATIAEIPKVAMLGKANKKNSPIGEKDASSFSDVLNTASGLNTERQIDEKSNNQILDPVQQQYMTVLMPLFQMNANNTAVTNNSVVMTNPISVNPVNINKLPDSAFQGAVELEITGGVTEDNNVVALNGALTSEAAIVQTLNSKTGIADKPNSSDGIIHQTKNTSEVLETIGTQTKADVENNSSLTPQTTDSLMFNKAQKLQKLQMSTELASKLPVETISQPSPVALLKPLEAAGFQQVFMTADNRPMDDAKKVSEVSYKVVPLQHQNISNSSILSDMQQGEQGNVATDKKTFTEELPEVGDNIREGMQVSFGSVLHEASRDNKLPSSESIPQPSAQPLQDTHEVVSQIVDHARLVKGTGASEMIIKLKPEHLGELTLKVAVDNGVVSATFHTSNNEVRGIIEASIQQLKNDMAQQGLKVDNVGVYAGMGQLLSDGQGEAQKRQEWKPSTKKDNKKEFSEALSVIEAVTSASPDAGVDYRI